MNQPVPKYDEDDELDVPWVLTVRAPPHKATSEVTSTDKPSPAGYKPDEDTSAYDAVDALYSNAIMPP
jgi:hypothetical protein